jgi:hypothetical protein
LGAPLMLNSKQVREEDGMKRPIKKSPFCLEIEAITWKRGVSKFYS